MDELETERNRALFDKYVTPNIDQIRSLVKYYINNHQDVDSYLSYVLEQMFKYIHTYDEERPLETWLGIVTKRSVFNCNIKDAERNSHYTGIELTPSMFDSYDTGGETASLLDNISEDLLNALMQVSPLKLSAFLLQVQGYKTKEIVEIEYKRGHLDKSSDLSIEIIKSRIYGCRKQLQRILEKNGIKRKQKRSGNKGDSSSRS